MIERPGDYISVTVHRQTRILATYVKVHFYNFLKIYRKTRLLQEDSICPKVLKELYFNYQ